MYSMLCNKSTTDGSEWSLGDIVTNELADRQDRTDVADVGGKH